jgi:hypothetical protein
VNKNQIIAKITTQRRKSVKPPGGFQGVALTN